MENYSDMSARLDDVERDIADLQEQVQDIIKRIDDLEKLVTPAVQAQRIRDEWDGM